MKKPAFFTGMVWTFFAVQLLSSSFAADRVELHIDPKGVLQVHSQIKLPFSSSQGVYTIEKSSNLTNWTVVGFATGAVGLGDEVLRKAMGASGVQSFFRVKAAVNAGAPDDNDGSAVYGYADAFSQQLQSLGQLPLQQFAQLYSLTNQFLNRIGFDVTQAEFFDHFNLDPAVNNATNPVKRFTDFRFNSQEMALFKTNGFVVSPRLGSYSFADAFYNIYFDDLPVFVSTDAILQAWHRTFTVLIEELEETYLAVRLSEMINAMASQVPSLYAQAQGTPLEQGVKHADYHLAVAKSLLDGSPNPGMLGQPGIQQTLQDIAALHSKEVSLYGTNRTIDFSQFTIRGHYETSPVLGRYFQAMIWLGIVDLRIIDPQPDGWEFAGAVALNLLLDRSAQRGKWDEIERTLQFLFGLGDSLNFAQLNDVLASANVTSPYTGLQTTYSNILTSNLGVQNIRSGYFMSPFSREQLKLPRSFSVFPQRFTFDNWAQSKVVLDDVIWDDDGIPGVEDKVLRRIPSALDVAFSVLGNSVVTSDITARIASANGHPFRDGFRYQHNLAAVRDVIDSQDAAIWTNSIYSSWLKTLRSLSNPTTDSKFPQALRTKAWSMKNLNTQLASWTHLRHDTVLYVKQSYTAGILCSYPKAFVEPRIEFWENLRDMALKTRDLLKTYPTNGQVLYEVFGLTYSVSQHQIQTNWLATLDHFVTVTETLKSISEKELLNADLSQSETEFLEDLVERRQEYGSGNRLYTGWYPQLFLRSFRQQFPYGPNQGSDFWDALVTDIHTAIPNLAFGFPGSILHQGVGNVHMAFLAVDCADGSMNMFAGPVLSHYEFETDSNTRKTDTAWKTEIKAGTLPPSPEWTRSYLVPGAYQVPTNIPTTPTGVGLP